MLILKYILSALLRAFLACVAVLYGVMFIVEWIRIGKLISFKEIDVFFLTMIPLTVFIIPMSLLFSILIVLERLSSDSEIIAMKACGVKSRSIFIPILGLSAICMIFHLILSTYVGPSTLAKIQARLVKEVPQKIYSLLKEREFVDIFKGFIIYIESVNQIDKQLHSIFIDARDKDNTIITANTGTINVTPSSVMMKLSNGSVYMETSSIKRYITFEEYMFSIEADLSREVKIGASETATQKQLRRLIRKDPKPKWIKEYHNRYAFPVLNIIIGFVGVIFGIQRPRSPKYTGFIMGLSTIMGYYLLFVFADRLVKGEVMNPIAGAWFPNMVFSLILITIFLWRRSRWSEGRI